MPSLSERAMRDLRWRAVLALLVLTVLATGAWEVGSEQARGRRADAALHARDAPHGRPAAPDIRAQLRRDARATGDLGRLQSILLAATLAALLASGFLVVRPLLRRTLREMAFVRLLQDVAVAANEASSERDALEKALRLICRVTRWSAGHALLLDRTSGDLVGSGIWHLDDPERLRSFRDASNGLRFAKGVGLPGRVRRDRASGFAGRMTGDADRPRAAHADRASIRLRVAMPVLVRKEVVGVLEFFSPRRRPPDQELLDVLGQVGTQLGRVIERHRAEERLAHRAGHDPLTGLPNRSLLDDRLRMASARALRRGTPVALLFVDIDRFKPVNDTLGHAAGDELLQRIADRIREHVRPEDTVARVGGDEFVVLYERVSSAADARERGERLALALGAPFPVAGQTVTVGASIGVALSDRGLDDTASLLAQADGAMYRAKQAGDGTVTVFDPAHDALDPARAAARTGLRLA